MEVPLAAVHNQINPITKLFMILLRIAIGWHLLYEGYTKINSTIEGKKPFSAEMYLRNSTGPLRFYFRGLVDDNHGVGFLNAEVVGPKWDEYVNVEASKLGLSQESKKRVEDVVATNKDLLKKYFDEKSKDIERYEEDIQAFEDQEQRPLEGYGKLAEGQLLRPALPKFEWDAHKKAQQALDKKRMELTAPVMKWSDEIVAAVKTEASGKPDPKTASAATPTVPGIEWRPQLREINLTTMYGLAIIGALMIVGLFTRTACLAGAALLTLFYLSMPPWPGLDPAPISEGTYLIVNKNLIEIIAMLMMASSPVGVWGGLDSLIRGLITRPLFGVGKKEVLTLE